MELQENLQLQHLRRSWRRNLENWKRKKTQIKRKPSKWTEYWHEFCREAGYKKRNPDSLRHVIKNLTVVVSKNADKSIS